MQKKLCFVDNYIHNSKKTCRIHAHKKKNLTKWIEQRRECKEKQTWIPKVELVAFEAIVEFVNTTNNFDEKKVEEEE